jgi:4-alpha-glucanotransferase
VWEATVVPALADTGIRYVTVDDYHFLCTGKEADDLDGYFTTEEGGHRLDLFPISEQLRYRFPFSPAVDAVAYLQQLADDGGESAIYFDDIEKFGIWPETYEWVYERGWLREFIERVLANPQVKTRTFEEFHSSHRTRGIVYLPTTSYIEMNEWTLPAKAAGQFASLIAREKHAGTYEAHKPFVRGGIWKSFMSRYPEANWMHKRMTALSRRLEEARPKLDEAQRVDLETQLYLAQANDAYWHGLFGGVYMPHLRRGIYKSLVNLEAALDRHAPRAHTETIDLDHDGIDEVMLHTNRLQAILKLDGKAAICELDAYELGQNFGDTLRRTSEHYHARALEKRTEAKAGSGIASAHERFHVKHDIQPKDLESDGCARCLFTDAWVGLHGPTPLTEYEVASISADGHANASFTTQSGGVKVEKRIAVRDNKLVVDYRLEVAAPILFQVNMDIAMPCCDGFAGRYISAGRILGGFGETMTLLATKSLMLDDRHMNGSVVLSSSRNVAVKGDPYYTVSQSEDGLEKVMQSVTLTLTWPVAFGTQETTVTLEACGGFDEGLLN